MSKPLDQWRKATECMTGGWKNTESEPPQESEHAEFLVRFGGGDAHRICIPWNEDLDDWEDCESG